MKPVFARLLLLSLTSVIYGCGTSSIGPRSALGRVGVNDTITMSNMAYGNHQPGIMVGGVAGVLVDLAVNRGFENEFGEVVNIHDFTLRESLRSTFPMAMNRRSLFPYKVELVRDLHSVSGEEMLAMKSDARVYLTVTNYGFVSVPFAKTLHPTLTVTAELRKGDKVLWDESATADGDALPAATAEQFRTNPDLVKKAWTAAAQDVSDKLAEAFRLALKTE